MSNQMNDDSTHYELTMTAGQAFIAFVLLLFSLGAAFAFGVMIGRGHGDDRLIVQRETGVVTEASAIPAKGDETNIVELGVTNTDLSTAPILDPLAQPAEQTETAVPVTETAAAPAATPVVTEQPPQPAEAHPAPPAEKPATQPATAVPHYVQLFSSTDSKAAEALAAKLIESGYTSAYVERIPGDHGTISRVRVKYPSEEAARAAAEKLKSFVKGDVWVTKQ